MTREPPALKHHCKGYYICTICNEKRKHNTFKSKHWHPVTDTLIKWVCQECQPECACAVTSRTGHIKRHHPELMPKNEGRKNARKNSDTQSVCSSMENGGPSNHNYDQNSFPLPGSTIAGTPSAYEGNERETTGTPEVTQNFMGVADLIERAWFGDEVALSELRSIFDSPSGISEDATNAVLSLKRDSLRGDSEAMLKLSFCYKQGLGVTQDLNLSRIYLAAAERGNEMEKAKPLPFLPPDQVSVHREQQPVEPAPSPSLSPSPSPQSVDLPLDPFWGILPSGTNDLELQDLSERWCSLV